jgi:hypothetical protein
MAAGAVIGQANATGLLELGGVVGNMAPSVLLAIGLIWAVRRGDGLVKEVHALRDKHEAKNEQERRKFEEVLERVIKTMDACERRGRQ